MDRGAWWAAVHGVAQSRTRLKRLSSIQSLQGKIDIIYACVQDLVFNYWADRDLRVSGLHFRLPRGVRPRLEGKQRTPLSSQVATRVSWSPLSGLKGVLYLTPSWVSPSTAKRG